MIDLNNTCEHFYELSNKVMDLKRFFQIDVKKNCRVHHFNKQAKKLLVYFCSTIMNL